MPEAKGIPLPGTTEFDDLIKEYKVCSTARIEEMAKQFDYKNGDSFVNSMRHRFGVFRAYQPPVTVLSKASGDQTTLEEDVLRLVQKETLSVGEISRRVDRSAETVIKTIDSLREKSYDVELDEVSRQVVLQQEPSKVFEPTEFKYFRNFYKIGLVSDPHFCSKYQQITLLHDAYALFNREKVDFILNAGDLVDGKNMYRGQENEVFKHGSDDQAQYVVDNYPKAERNIKTYVIGGSHDRSFYRDSGQDILHAICKERKDLVYRGYFKAEFKIRGLSVCLQHPGGGVAYARSYRMQKIIENMMGFVSATQSAAPVLEVFGHWHIPCHLPSYMGTDAVSLPCFQAQTPFLEQKGLMPVLGYAIAEIWLDKDGHLSSTKVVFYIQNSQGKKGDY